MSEDDFRAIGSLVTEMTYDDLAAVLSDVSLMQLCDTQFLAHWRWEGVTDHRHIDIYMRAVSPN